MSLARKEIFEFGEFRLDVSEHTIERIDGAQNGTLTDKAFQALVLLVRRRGHLVSKDELIQFIWPDTIVEENNLEKCIHHLRHFLGETPAGTGYIETIRKHGYRFVGNVQAIEVSGSWIPETFRFAGEQNGSAALKADQLITPEEIIETGSRSLLPVHLTDAQVGSEKIVEPRPEATEPIQFPLRGALLLSAIALAVIGSLAGLGYYVLIRPDVVTAGTRSEEAYQFYLRAMNLSEKRGLQNLEKSLAYLERAVELDPNYALAWSAKALVHNDMVPHIGGGQHEHFPKSMQAIKKAFDIDPNLSDAHSALCHFKNRYEYDFTEAETACKRAVELDPNSSVAHKTNANFLYTRGRFEEAIVEIKKAIDLQQVSYQNQQIYALTLYFARRYPEAEEQFKSLIELNPNQISFIHGRLIKVLEEQGKESEAFEALVKMRTIENAGNGELERLKSAYRKSGWRGVQIERIRTAEAGVAINYFDLAGLYAKVGNKDKALECLEKVYLERSFLVPIIHVEPQLDSLYQDPRFVDLVRRIEGK